MDNKLVDYILQEFKNQSGLDVRMIVSYDASKRSSGESEDRAIKYG